MASWNIQKPCLWQVASTSCDVPLKTPQKKANLRPAWQQFFLAQTRVKMEKNRMHFELFMQFVTMVGTIYLWEPIFIRDAKQWQQKPHKRIFWYSLYADIQFSWMEKPRTPKQKSRKKSQLVSRGEALLLDIKMGVASYFAFIVCNWFAGTWLLLCMVKWPYCWIPDLFDGWSIEAWEIIV